MIVLKFVKGFIVKKVLFIIICLFLTSMYAKDIGIAWVGKSSMQDDILKGFLLQTKIFKNKFNIEIKKELKTLDDLKNLTQQWDTKKDGMILLRSSAAKMLSYTKTNIPTFIGGSNHPIALGAVNNTLSPQGNITGVTYYISKKTTLKMINLFLPNIKSILFLGEKGHFSTPIEQEETQRILKNDYKVEYKEFISDNLHDILNEVKNKKDQVAAIILGNQALIFDNANSIIKIAENIPVFSYSKSALKNGALAGYVADDVKLGKELAKSVYSVLFNGKKIKEVSIKVDNNPVFYVNKRTLDNLHLEIPFRLNNKVVFINK